MTASPCNGGPSPGAGPRRARRGYAVAALCLALLLPTLARGQSGDGVAELQALTREREILTRELVGVVDWNERENAGIRIGMGD